MITILILWILVFPTKSYYFSLLHFTYTGIYTQCWWNVSKMYIDLYMYLYIKPMYIVINVWTSNSLGISMAYYIIMCKIPKFDCACTCIGSPSLAKGGEICISSKAKWGVMFSPSVALWKLIPGVLITHKNLMSGMAGQCQKIQNLG